MNIAKKLENATATLSLSHPSFGDFGFSRRAAIARGFERGVAAEREGLLLVITAMWTDFVTDSTLDLLHAPCDYSIWSEFGDGRLKLEASLHFETGQMLLSALRKTRSVVVQTTRSS